MNLTLLQEIKSNKKWNTFSKLSRTLGKNGFVQASFDL